MLFYMNKMQLGTLTLVGILVASTPCFTQTTVQFSLENYPQIEGVTYSVRGDTFPLSLDVTSH